MTIYTRTGDDGTTALYNGRHLSKGDPQIVAYGSVDELTCALGVFAIYIQEPKEKEFIKSIQQDLYVIMSFLAQAPTNLSDQEKKVDLFEQKINIFTEQLPQLTQFILPQGSLVTCWAHMARVVCRRSERSIICYFQKSKLMNEKKSRIIMKYVNRLSDLLFTYARIYSNE